MPSQPLPVQAVGSAAPPRTNTPPRSSGASIRILRICMDERVLGGIEVNEASTLADARQIISEDEIHGVPENYLFLFGGAPVSRRQECRRRAVDCFPFLIIIPENARVPSSGAAAGGERNTIASGEVDVPRAAGLPTPHGSPSAQAEPPASFGMESVEGSPPNVYSAGIVASPDSAAEMEVAEPSDVAAALPMTESENPGPVMNGGVALELQITDGPLEGTTVTVGEEGARIGRHTSNTLVIPEAGISRYHCEICYMNGEFLVRDLGSTTGTFFYLRPHGHFLMFVGLMVKLGETELQVLSQTAVGTESPEQVVLFYEGPLAGHKVHIPSTGITIGRRHNNNLVLVQDGTVSAHHAVIFCEEGEFFLSDLGSCNGTCIRLSMERTDSDWHPIMDGDMIGAGCTKIQCRIHR